MAFQASSLGTDLINRPRVQPEGILKGSLRNSYKLGTLEVFTSGRVGRSGGSKSDFTSTGANADYEWQAVSFTAVVDDVVDHVLIKGGKTGSPAGTTTVEIWTDDSGLPDAIQGTSDPSDALTINSSFAITAGFVKYSWTANNPVLRRGDTYWVVIKTTGYTYTNGATEFWLDTDTEGSSEVAKYDANAGIPWTTAGATVGGNVVVTSGNWIAGDSIIDSADDFVKYSLFGVARSPIKNRDLSLTISGTSAQSGRVNRGTGTVKDFTSTTETDDGKWWAVKFTQLISGEITQIKIPLKKLGSPEGTAIAMIYSSALGLPDSQVDGDSASVTINTGVSTTAGYITFTWTSNKPDLTKDTDYWLVIKTSGYTYSDGVTELSLATDISGSNEVAKYDSDAGTHWTTAGATVGCNVKVGGIAIAGTVTLSAISGLDTAELVAISAVDDNGWGSLTDVLVDDGYPESYDTIELWAVPELDTTNYERIRYFRSMDINTGPSMMPIADCFDPVYTAILLRRTNTLTLSKEMATYSDLGKYQGRMCSFVVEMHPGGGGGVSEYFIFAGAFLNITQNHPDNALVMTPAEGGMGALLIYTP
jgi:hypothetical protein